MSKYAGLTDHPEDRKVAHGNPIDWKVTNPFDDENKAREWEKRMIAVGFKGGPGGKGWKYGYTYTTTNNTIE